MHPQSDFVVFVNHMSNIANSLLNLRINITPSHEIICSYHFCLSPCPYNFTLKNIYFDFRVSRQFAFSTTTILRVPRESSCMLLICVCTIPSHANAHYFLSFSLSFSFKTEKKKKNSVNQKKKKKKTKIENQKHICHYCALHVLNRIRKLVSLLLISCLSGRTHVHAALALVGYHFQTMREDKLACQIQSGGGGGGGLKKKTATRMYRDLPPRSLLRQ